MRQAKFPIITIIIIGINLAVFAYMITTYGTTTSSQALWNTGAMLGQVVLSDLSHQWWRLITPMFIHIGAVHLASNLLSLWIILPSIERILGHIRTAILYILTGICGNIACATITPTILSAGASGAIFGLFGLLLYIQLFRPDLNFLSEIYISIIIYNIIYTFTATGISIPAHLGGLASGFLLAPILLIGLSSYKAF